MRILQAFAISLLSTGLLHAEVATLGSVSGQYAVGEVLYDGGFEYPDDWVLQIQDPDSDGKHRVAWEGGVLDLYMPARGCTAWLKQKFSGPIAVVYEVRCPEETIDGDGIQARDINNFWHCSDPVQAERLLDPELYDGGFGSYSKMLGYYASTGGGGHVGNQTTRARRYPREDYAGNPVAHIALDDRDGQEDYLITPGKWHTVQLVAANGLVQYIVDGKLVYEYGEGDTVTVQTGREPAVEKTYTFAEFPPHTEGYAGLRMVRTHHQYRDFKVYQLDPVAPPPRPLDIAAYLAAADPDTMAPSPRQRAMLEPIIPEGSFQPAPPISDRSFWEAIARTESGRALYEKALAELEVAPEVPISDELYRLAQKTGDRTLYKPRYYSSSDRLERFMLAECMENGGRFLPQLQVYVRAFLDMKSWLHPNHDKGLEVLEGKRMSIDLGSRLFGSNMALVELLVGEKLPAEMRAEIKRETDRRIVQSFLKTCREGGRNNSWIRGGSNWNAVCTSGSTFTTIAMAQSREDRLVAVGAAINAMSHFLSGFGRDGYCSEGIGYWGYGFGHYLYLAQILHDFTGGRVDLFTFDDPELLRKVGNFPSNYHIQKRTFPAFSDSNIWNPMDFGNFARAMVAYRYGSQWPYDELHEHAIEQLIQWTTLRNAVIPGGTDFPPVSYFDDRGIVVSRGQQEVPFSIALKAGDNNENHNHSDVGSYSMVLSDVLVAGDIGKPIYIGGAFSKDNKSRSSWGHPVPRVDGELQSNGAEHFGRVLATSFEADRDRIEMDISAAYEVPSLKKLIRTFENARSSEGTITIVDRFSAARPIEFGTAVMSYGDFEQLAPNKFLLSFRGKTVSVEVESEGGEVKLVREPVPVELQSYLTAYRIGIDFVDPLQAGSITMRFKPSDTPIEEAPEDTAARMQWWRDAKFGMFIHWGVYSRAGGEWKGDLNHGEWFQFTAKIPLSEYTEFAKGFNPVEFDAEEWVRIAKDAGMKYLVITAKHHDGFAMFDSYTSPYNIVQATEFARDPIRELAEACHKAGLKFGVYYSLGRDWQHPDVPTGGESGRPVGDRSNLIDFPDEKRKDFSHYYDRKVKPQVRELLTQYAPVDILWFDTPEKITEAQSHELRQVIRTLNPDCIINNRIGHGLGDYGTPEQKIPSKPGADPWETCMTISKRFWGYNKAVGYRPAEDLVRNLIDITSKGGNYLLNVGPTGEGIIPAPSVDRLNVMGQWLQVNGESIYGCGPTPFGAEVGAYSATEKDKHGNPTFVPEWKWRATTAPGKIYLHVFEWPETIEIPAVEQRVANAYFLADPAKTPLTFSQTATSVSVSLPRESPDPIATVVCLELDPRSQVYARDVSR